MSGEKGTKLPDGWAACVVGDFLTVKNGYAFKSKDYVSDGVGIPIIRISDIKNGSVTTEGAARIPTDIEVNDFEILKGDLLIAMSGATTGKTGVFIEDCRAFQNQRVGNIKLLSDELSNKFRDYLITSLTPMILDEAYGGAQPNISGRKIEEFPVMLPPLNEQRRIADKLDHVLGALERCKTRLEKAQTLLKRFRQSTLNAATTGKLTQDWREENGDSITREEMLETIHSDTSFKSKWKSNSHIDGCEIQVPPTWASAFLGEVVSVKSGNGLTAKEMIDGGIPVYGGNGITGYHNATNTISKTIVIGRVGFYCGSVHITPDKAWITDNAMVVSYSNLVLTFDYSHTLLLSANLRETSASSAQPVISGTKIYPTSIPLPPPRRTA